MDREEDLNIIIQRLKDSLAQRERTPEYETADNRSRTCVFHQCSIVEQC